MAKGKPPIDEERLPWLEPYRDSPAVPAAPAAGSTNRRGTAVAVGGIAALAAALTAGYYIGQRDPRPVPSAEIALGPATPAPVAPPTAPPVAPPAPPVADLPPPVNATTAATTRKVASAKIAKKPPARKLRQRKVRTTVHRSTRPKAVRAVQQRRAAARPVAYRAWPRMPSPGPAGQVIQLGAFRNPAGANRAYRVRVARYPSLGRMPRVVVPVITKPHGQILYVLRLGTTSRQQSRIICRNLRASGNHCLVIG